MVEQPRALYTLDGATGSRRRELVEQLPQDGFVVVRGMPSRYQEINGLLTPKAQSLTQGIDFNPDSIKKLPTSDARVIADLATEVIIVQHDEAVRLMQEGNTVFIESSVLRLINSFWVAWSEAERNGDNERARISYDMIERAKSAVPLVDTVTGFVLISDVYRDGDSYGIFRGYEDMESSYLRRTVQEISRTQGFPVCQLNPNTSSLKEQRAKIRKFVTKP